MIIFMKKKLYKSGFPRILIPQLLDKKNPLNKTPFPSHVQGEKDFS